MLGQDTISFLVTPKEYKLLLAATLLDQPYEGFVKRARLVDGRYKIQFTMKQLKAFVKYLDFEKDWFEYGPQRRALRVIIARLQEFLQLLPLVASNN